MALDPITNMEEKTPPLQPLRLPTNKSTISPVNIDEIKNFNISDYNSLSNDNYNQLAINQSRLNQLGRGIGRYATNILPEIIGNFGAMLDFEDYVNQDNEVGNWLTNAMTEFQNERKKDMPIYRENPDKPLDIGDFAWWAENGSELATSVGGFAATAAMNGGIFAPISKISSFTAGATTLGNSILLNQAESIKEAANVYDTVIKDALVKGKDMSTAKINAAEAAASSININRVNILLNLTSAGMFVKGPTNKLLSELSLKNTVKKIGYESLQEGTEEIVNLQAEKQGIKKGLLKNSGEEYNASLFNDFVNNVFTMEGAEAFVLGAIGGAGQTIISSGIGNINSKWYKGKYAEHRENLAKQKDILNSPIISRLLQNPKDNSSAFFDSGSMLDIMNRIKEAEDNNDTTTSNSLKELLLSEQVYNVASSKLGLNTLKAIYEDFSKLSPEQAAEKNLSKDYKEQSKKAIENIDILAKNYLISSKFQNSKQVYDNLNIQRDLKDRLTNKVEELNEKEKVFNNFTRLLFGETVDFNTVISDDSNRDYNKIKQSIEFKELNDINNEALELRNDLKKSIEKFAELVSEKTQKQTEKTTKTTEKTVTEEVINNPNAESILNQFQDTEDTLFMNSMQDQEMTADDVVLDDGTEGTPLTVNQAKVLEKFNNRYKDNKVLELSEMKELTAALNYEGELTPLKLALLYNSNEQAKEIINKFYKDKKTNKEAAIENESAPTSEETPTTTTEEVVDPVKTSIKNQNNYDNSTAVILHDREIGVSDDIKERSLIDPSISSKYTSAEERARYETGISLVNNPYFNMDGRTLYYELDMNHPYNKTNPAFDDLVVETILYMDGNVNNKSNDNRIIIGKIKSQKNIEPSLQLSTVRKILHDKYLNEKNTITEAGLSSTIERTIPGIIWNTSDYGNPLSKLPDGHPLVLSVAVKDTTGIRLNNTNATNKGESFESPTISQKDELSDGNVYMLVTNNAGVVIPVHLNTVTLENGPTDYIEKVNELLDNLNEENHKGTREQLSQYVIANFNYQANSPKPIQTFVTTEYKDEKGKVKKTKTKINYTVEEYKQVLLKTHIQVSTKKINTGTYNEDLASKGIIISNIHPKINFHSGSVQLSTTVSKEETEQPTETAENNTIKSGVSELFESNPELANIGTQQAYSNYLDTIFPNSKVKDIVYHGTRSQEKFDFFDENKIGELDSGYFGRGFYFSPDLSYANGYSKLYNGYNIAALVNLKNPLETDANQANTNISLINNDGAIVRVGENLTPELNSENYNPNEIGEIVVSTTEQIHILGSKQDVEGFKEFVNKPSKKSEDNSVKEKIQNIINVSKEFSLTKDEKHYQRTIIVNNKPVKKLYKRVTSLYKDDIKRTPLLDSSVIIGNKLDIILRDFFNNELKSFKDYDAFHTNKEGFNDYIKELNKLKNTFDKRGETVYAKDIVLYDDIHNVAGTVDLLTVDKEGKIKIYDLKSKRSGLKYLDDRYTPDKLTDRESFTYQLSIYRILLFNTYDLLAEELSIIPLKVYYDDVDTKTHTANLLDLLPIEALDEMTNLKNIDKIALKNKFKNEISNTDNKDWKNDIKPSARTFKDTEEDDVVFKSNSEKSLITKEELQKEVDKMKLKLPKDISFNITDDLYKIFKVDAWGAYLKGVIYLNENNKRGTTYHEAFHAVFRSILNPVERDILYKEAIEKYADFITNEEIKFYNEKYGDLGFAYLLEEYMADDYMEFSINEDSKSKLIPNFILNLFNKIKKWYNILTNNNNVKNLNNLFENIESGYYKTSSIKRNTSFNDAAYNLKGMSTTELIDGINHFKYLFDTVLLDLRNHHKYPSNMADTDIINKEGGITQIMGHVITRMISYRNSAKEQGALKISDRYDNIANNWFSSTPIPSKPKTILNETGNKIYTTLPGQQYGDFYLIALESLRDYSIVINSKNLIEQIALDEVNLSIEELDELYDEESTYYESYQIAANQISSKEKLSPTIKRKFSRIKKISNNKEVLDVFGFPTYENPNIVYRFLETNASNIYDPIFFTERLEFLKNSQPFMNDVFNIIHGDKDLFSEVYSHIGAKAFNHYTFMRQDSDGEFKMFGSNRVNIKSVIINELKNTFQYSKILENNEVILSQANKFKNAVETISVKLNAPAAIVKTKINNVDKLHIDNNIIEEIADLFKEYNIGISYEQLSTLSNLSIKEFKSLWGITANTKGIKSLANLLAEGINILDTVDTEGNENSTLDSIAKQLTPVTQNLFESSFRNVKNKSMYAHTMSNFLNKKIWELVNKPDVLNLYLNTDFYQNNYVLNTINNDPSEKNKLGISIFDGLVIDGKHDGIDYTSLNAAQYEILPLIGYYNQGSKNHAYYKFPILSDAPQLPLLRFKKINNVNVNEEILDAYYTVVQQEIQRINNLKLEDSFIAKIKNVSKRGNKFLFLPFMNSFKGNINNKAEVKKFIKDNLELGFQVEVRRLKDLNIIKTSVITLENGNTRSVIKNSDLNVLPNLASESGDFTNFIRDYYYNARLMNIQNIILFSGDLAYYKESEDFQKRNKQTFSPKQYLDTSRTNKKYASIYLKDNEIPSSGELIDFIKVALKDYDKNYVDKIIAKFEENNETDAQSFITIDRFKEIKEGLGQWTDNHQNAYDKIKKNQKLNVKEFGLFSPIKPFMFTHSYIEKYNTIIPVQNKNSEFVLLPQVVAKDKSGKLKHILNKLEETERTTGLKASAQFESAVKVGLYGEVNPNEIKDYVIHELDNSDYGIQVETPLHYTDYEGNFGSQIRKLMMGDTQFNTIFTDNELPDIKKIFNADEVTFEMISKLYQEAIQLNLKEGYEYANGIVKDNTRLSEYLISQIRDKKLGNNLQRAVSLNADGDFNLDLYNPYHSKKVESLINALYKNNVTKQKINGGQFINVSSFGFSDQLNIITKGENFLHMEAYMPWWSKEFFLDAIDANGDIDLTKINDPRILDLVMYRIPTEDKYSMFKIRVKGFFEEGTGGAIILPREASTLAGLDFDVDKLFAMIYNMEKVNGKIKIVEPSLETKESRDNLLLSLSMAILNHKETASQIFQPGSFDVLKESAYNVELMKMGLNFNDYNTLKEKQDKIKSFELDPSEPSTQAEFFHRNMTGKKLIGIFANHNVNHSITQYTNLKLRDSFKMFDREVFNLNNITSLDGITKISRNLATFLAAVVDNAKDPIAKYINLNTVTADTYSFLIRLGYSIDEVALFMSQPVLVTLVDKIFNDNASLTEQDNIINNEIDDLKNKIKNTINQTTKSSGIHNFNKSELVSLHKKSYLYNQAKTTLDKETLVNNFSSYFNDQLLILETFKEFKKMSSELATIVRNTRPDAIGAGPTNAKNESYIRNKEVLNYLKYLENVNDYFNNDNLTLIKDFENYGITKPTESLSRLFPWNNYTFMNLKDTIEEEKVGSKLSVEEIDFINYSIYSYMVSSKDYMTNKTLSKDLIMNFPKELTEFKNNNPNNKFVQMFLNRFKVVPYNQNKIYSQIVFYNTGMDSIEKQNLSDIWQQMFNHPNEKIRSIAKKLLNYTFMSSGFNFTPYGFNNLIPYEEYVNLGIEEKDSLNTYIKDEIKNSILGINDDSLYNSFYTQFIQNNFSTLNFVKSATKDNVQKIELDKETKLFNVEMRFNNSSWINNNDEFATFIKYKTSDKKNILLVLNGIDEDGNVIYTQTKTLGMKGLSLEYNPNNSQLTSLFKENNIGIDINLDRIELIKEEIKNFKPKEINNEITTVADNLDASDNTLDITNMSNNEVLGMFNDDYTEDAINKNNQC